MSKAKILIVEDEWLVAQGISENLRDLDYEVVGTAASGEEALRLAAETSPDLVLMDILLRGEMDGIEAAERLRQQWDLPVVYLTAYADPHTLERAKVTEPYGYLLKPFEARELHSIIEMALYKNRAEKRLKHLNQVLRAIRNVNQLIVQEKDRHSLIEKACRILLEVRNYYTAWLVLLAPEEKVVDFAIAGDEGHLGLLRQKFQQGKLPACAKQVFSEQTPLRTNNLSCQRECYGLTDYRNRGALIFPLVHHGQCFGVLGVCVPLALVGDSEENSLLEELANDLALALHKLDLEERQRQALEALRQSEFKFSSIFNHAPVLMTLSTLEEGRYLEVNEIFTRVSGYSREEALGRTPVELGWVSPEDRLRLKEALKKSRYLENIEVTLTARDGRQVFGLYNGIVLSLEGEGVLLSIINDITALKEVQASYLRAVREADERRRETAALLEATRAVLRNHPFETAARSIFMAAQNIIGAKAGYVAVLNADGTQAEMLFLETGGLPCRVAPNLPLPVRGLRAEACKRRETVFHNNFMNSEYVRFLPPGHATLENVLFVPLLVQGEVAGLLGLANKPGGFTGKDARLASAFGELAAIALSHAKTLQSLQESEEKYRTLIESANDAIVILEADTGKVLEVNRKVEELLGRPREDIIGQHHTAFQPPADEALYRAIFARHVQAGGLSHEEVEILDSSGAVIPLEVSSKLLEVQGRKVLLLIMRDLRERRRMEEERRQLQSQLIQTQKMEALGTLAGGVAHDFNNILAAIMGLAELAWAKLPEGLPERSYIRDILTAGHRAQELVNQILSFSRQRQLERKPLSLTPLIKEAVKFLRASLPSTITIQSRLAPRLPLVVADPVQIHQVLMNLATNSAHAMEEQGGILHISLKETHLGADEVSPYEGLLPGPYLELTVRDTGHGIAPEALPRIFEPFFTTKEPGKGTGLGLAVVYGIVVSHGGFIRVASEPGRGTTVRVYFPVAAAGQKREPLDPAVPLPRGQGRILFVDDDQDFFPIGKRLLEFLGYEVAAYSSSLAALAAFQEDPYHFDLLITDQTMPGLTGLELAAACTAIRPGFPIILCTGFSEQVTSRKVAQIGIQEVVRKPFTLRQIGLAVQKVLKKSLPPSE